VSTEARNRLTRYLPLLLCLSIAATGCATNAAIRDARLAEAQQDFDRAVIEYSKAVRAHPDDRNARASLEQAKLRAAQDHFTRARRLASVGKLEEALIEYQLSLELNPTNQTIQDEMRTARAQMRAKIAVSEEGKTRLETLIAQSLQAPLPGNELPDDIALPDTLTSGPRRATSGGSTANEPYSSFPTRRPNGGSTKTRSFESSI
jgi:tetratricopeptide (TPR) repeat protein